MRARFLFSLSVAGLVAHSAVAQTTAPTKSDIETAQALATLNATNIKNANDKSTADLATLKAIQDASAGGSGGGGDYGKSAEALLISHYAMIGAAQKLATDLHGNTSRTVLVVWGSSPPPVGAYFQFVHDRTMLEEQLSNAFADWTAAYAARPKPVPPPKKAAVGKGGKKIRAGGSASDAGKAIVDAGMGAVAASNPVGLAITAALTLGSVARIDTTISGVDITTDQEQSRAIVLAALQAKSLSVSFSEFDLPTYPTEANLGLTQLTSDYTNASKAYRQQYLPLLAAAGKADKLAAAVAAAGAELSAAITAADAFRKAVYASTNGVSAATGLMTAKTILDARATESILFLRNIKTAATVRSNKGFFVGLTRSPSDFEAATSIDYLLLEPTAAASLANPKMPAGALSGSAVFYSGLVHLWKLKEFLANYPEAGVGPIEKPVTPSR